MIRNNILLLVILLLNLNFAQASAPRVIEVQEKIKKDISSFLDKFAPKTKYSIQVKVNPLRRSVDQKSSSEDLPFMEFQEELILDEWDDPKANIYSLYSRIIDARISVFIEDKVRIEDRAKFKDALLRDVNLVPGRDIVTLESITTPVLETAFNWRDQTEILLLGIMLMIVVVLGIGLNSLAKKIVPQKTTSSETNKNTASTNMPLASATVNSRSLEGSTQLSSGFKGDFSIQDPSKINEVVGKKIIKLLELDNFPTLADMVILEDLLIRDPVSFSYLVYEFPIEKQKIIYQLGRGEHWFKGFSEVGSPSKIVLITLDRMLRSRTAVKNVEFERLLIHCWRLDKHLSNFIKSIEKDNAFEILCFLPKGISIPVARECFPGSWGSILESRHQKGVSNTSDLITQCLRLQPLFNYDSLQIFKNRKDLLCYLDTVEPHEEKDIYSVMGEDNELSNVRPPFFYFFELESGQRREIYTRFSINDWALACFNIQRNEKDLLTEIMDEKEKYLFSHILKTIDQSQNQDLTQHKIAVRQMIAQVVYEEFSSTSHQETKSLSEESNTGEELYVA